MDANGLPMAGLPVAGFPSLDIEPGLGAVPPISSDVSVPVVPGVPADEFRVTDDTTDEAVKSSRRPM